MTETTNYNYLSSKIPNNASKKSNSSGNTTTRTSITDDINSSTDLDYSILSEEGMRALERLEYEIDLKIAKNKNPREITVERGYIRDFNKMMKEKEEYQNLSEEEKEFIDKYLEQYISAD